MAVKRGLSLRYKLLTILVALPMVTLGFYVYIALRTFSSDKLSYVWDASASVSMTSAAQVKSVLDRISTPIQLVVQGYDPSAKKLNPQAETLFNRDKNILKMSLYQLVDSGSHYEEKKQISKLSTDETPSLKDQEKFLAEIKESGVAIRVADEARQHITVGLRFGSAKDLDHIIAISTVQSAELFEIFERTVHYGSALLSESGKVIINLTTNKRTDFSNWDFFANPKWKNFPEGSAEIKLEDNEPALSAYARVRDYQMLVLTFVRKDQALSAVMSLVRKSTYFFVALVSFTLIFSVFASNGLTSTLSDLSDATKKVAEGQFDIRVDIKSGDEVGLLADGFNTMAGEVSRLMKETAEKARMSAELETAKTVQETLYPETRAELPGLSIAGHIEPASECGGDWWYYNQVGDKILLWIGDATGHGAGAALITSAAKSAATVLESMNDLSPGSAMTQMNRAIFETSRGGMMMTFFLGSIDTKTGEFIYCNASHDPPFLLRNTGQALQKKDLVLLNEINNPRLGDKRDTKYKETKIQLSPGDKILFYTDGIMDVKSPAGESWGERKFVRTVLKLTGEKSTADEMVRNLVAEFSEYRQNTMLVDDVTLFICQYEDKPKGEGTTENAA